MKMAEKEIYKRKPTIAVYGISNTLAIKIKEIDTINDFVIYESPDGKIHKVSIRYKFNGRYVFSCNKFEVYLDECVKI